MAAALPLGSARRGPMRLSPTLAWGPVPPLLTASQSCSPPPWSSTENSPPCSDGIKPKDPLAFLRGDNDSEEDPVEADSDAPYGAHLPGAGQDSDADSDEDGPTGIAAILDEADGKLGQKRRVRRGGGACAPVASSPLAAAVPTHTVCFRALMPARMSAHECSCVPWHDSRGRYRCVTSMSAHRPPRALGRHYQSAHLLRHPQD